MFEVEVSTPPPIPSAIVHEVVVEPNQDFQWNTPLSEIAQFHLSTMSDDEMDQDWKLNDFFGTVAVINLPQADLRREKVTRELEAIHCKFELFQGVDGRKDVDFEIWSKFYGKRGSDLDLSTVEGKLASDKINQGRAGCYLSHYTLIKKVKESFDRAMLNYEFAQNSQDAEAIKHAEAELKKYSRVLILEDDAGFGDVVVNEDNTEATKKDVGKRLRLAMKELPENWEMLYLMVQAKEEPEEISPHLCRIKSSVFLVGYALNYTMYQPIIDLLKQVEDPLLEKTRAIDVLLGASQHKHHVYALKKSVIYHEAGPSQIALTTRPVITQPNPWPWTTSK